MKALIAKKVGMTQIYDSESKSIAVTVLDASSCRAVQVKSLENDGYDAVQLTIGSSKKNNKSTASHYSKYNVQPGEGLWEVVVDEDSEIIPGQEINVSSILQPGNLVDITGTSKGKGAAPQGADGKSGEGAGGSCFSIRASAAEGCSAGFERRAGCWSGSGGPLL